MKPLMFGAATAFLFVSLTRGQPAQRPPSAASVVNESIAADDTPTADGTPSPRPMTDRVSRSPYLRVQDSRFLDAEGRQVLLHGMNVVSKSKADNYLSWHRSDDFANMPAWGMNCIRLGIIWDGLEPAPGKYDEAYLDGVEERVAWAAKHGLYVFLDMHQALFS